MINSENILKLVNEAIEELGETEVPQSEIVPFIEISDEVFEKVKDSKMIALANDKGEYEVYKKLDYKETCEVFYFNGLKESD